MWLVSKGSSWPAAALMAGKRPASPAGGSADRKQPKAGAPWMQGLLAAMEDPAAVVEKDEQIVVIRDKYPKV